MNIPIHVLKCDTLKIKKWNHFKIAAPFWRILWNEKPGWYVIDNTNRIALDPKKLILISPDTIFSTDAEIKNGHFFLEFIAGTPFDNSAKRIYSFEANSKLLEMVNDIKNCSDEIKKTLLMQSLASYILIKVPEKDLKAKTTNSKIIKTIEYLENNITAKIANQKLAKIANMNINAFINLFKKEIGQAPINYHLEQKIKHACFLLHQTNLSIEEVAEQSGFCDRYYFSRIFKKFRKIGPATYRKTVDTSIFLKST